jgi:DNA-binding GntR family transcriptional regulator
MTPEDPGSVLRISLPAKKALADDVVDHLRQLIMQGEFAPGARLREAPLAATLDVSRGPVRQALAQLEREGLVVHRPNRGSIVARLSRRDLEEVYSMRLAHEQVAMQWAATQATEADFTEMEAAVRRLAVAFRKRITVQQAAQYDLAFHDLVYAAARHKRLQRAWAELRPQVYLFLLARRYVGTAEFASLMVEQHAALIQVLRAHDVGLAREEAERHVRRSYRRVVEGYSSGDDSAEGAPTDASNPVLLTMTDRDLDAVRPKRAARRRRS